MSKTRPALPIDEILDNVVSLVRRGDNVVIHAPPGAGKTTRVPAALLDADAVPGRILMLEPRRIAARGAAARIAAERGERPGESIGYRVRFDSVIGPRTRVEVITEGILTRMLRDDPFLDGVGAVIFDEFHERSIHTDLGLALCREVQRQARADLRILVMSATMDTDGPARFLGDCPVVTSAGRAWPVEIRHLDRPDSRPLPLQVAAAVTRVLDETDGDVLVFLPGVGEIERARERLGHDLVGAQIDVIPLHGSLGPDEQDRAIRTGPRRKVVLATNVAETSVTIEGVTAVVDTGLARTMIRDAACELDRLELGRISRASADQRAGRAGRLRPGICLRLWTAGETHAMRPAETPELHRVDLAGPVLDLLDFGEPNPQRFPWFEAPDDEAINQALATLKRLGAVDDNGITALGRTMARLPLSPRIARMVVEGARYGQLQAVADAAAILSDRDVLGDPRSVAHLDSPSDVVDRVQALRGPRGHAGIRQAAERIARLGRAVLDAPPRPRCDAEEAIQRAVLAGWPDRVARRRTADPERGVLVGGRGVRLAPGCAVRSAPLFVCVDLDAGRRGERSEANVRIASAVEPDWLREHTRTTVDVAFDPTTERVVATQRTRYLDLVLDERPGGRPDDEAVRTCLREAAARDPAALVSDANAPRQLLARLRFLARVAPDAGLPAVDDTFWNLVLDTLTPGARSFDDLRRADWTAAILGVVGWQHRATLDRLAPPTLPVPSGSQIRVEYPDDGDPTLAARIQELFGLLDTPTVADGRVPVLLHLLAPNGRPQQVTRDLRSFWTTTYAEVRKELRQRYPKHDWPEDPWTATASRGPRRRSSP